MADFDLSINAIIGEITETIAGIVTRDLKKMTADMKVLVEGFQNRFETEGVAAVNEALAAEMHTAILDTYQATLIGPSGYRANEGRFSGGALLHALEDSSMVVGNLEGVIVGNTSLLDSAARQWARLNFGAGPAKGRTGSFPNPNPGGVNFGGGFAFAGLDEAPRPNFNVPQRGAGYFNNAGEFFLLGKGRPPKPADAARVGGSRYADAPPSKSGIAAKRFLDAGIEVFATRFIPLHVDRLNRVAESLPSGTVVIED